MDKPISDRARQMMMNIIGGTCITTEQFDNGCGILDCEFAAAQREVYTLRNLLEKAEAEAAELRAELKKENSCEKKVDG